LNKIQCNIMSTCVDLLKRILGKENHVTWNIFVLDELLAIWHLFFYEWGTYSRDSSQENFLLMKESLLCWFHSCFFNLRELNSRMTDWANKLKGSEMKKAHAFTQIVIIPWRGKEMQLESQWSRGLITAESNWLWHIISVWRSTYF